MRRTSRLRKPMLRQGNDLQPVAWHDAEPRLRDRIQQAGSADPDSVRFLVSAHAATEELFVLKEVVEGMVGAEGPKSVAVTWARSDKPQQANPICRACLCPAGSSWSSWAMNRRPDFSEVQ